MSGLMNKVKDAMGGHHEEDGRRTSPTTDHSKYGETGHGTGQHGITGTDSGYTKTGHRTGDGYNDGSGIMGTDSSRYGETGKGHSTGAPALPNRTHGTIGTANTTDEPGKFMGAGQMNPATSTTTNTTTSTTGSSHLPGSFPGQDNTASRHRDGREYVPPTGTHVGTGGSNLTGRGQTGSGYDRAEQAVTGRDTTGNYGSGLSSNHGNVHDSNLMDPASRDRGSNVMGGTAGGVTGSTGGMTTGHGVNTNKLHKSNDPRGFTGNNDPTNRYSDGQQGVLGTHGHHGIGGNSPTHGTTRETIGGQPYEHQGAGYGNDTSGANHRGAERAAAAAGAGAIGGQGLTDRTRHNDGRDQYNDNYNNGRKPIGSYTERDYDNNNPNHSGVYNGVTGHGSNRDRERKASKGRRSHKSRRDSTSSSSSSSDSDDNDRRRRSSKSRSKSRKGKGEKQGLGGKIKSMVGANNDDDERFHGNNRNDYNNRNEYNNRNDYNNRNEYNNRGDFNDRNDRDRGYNQGYGNNMGQNYNSGYGNDNYNSRQGGLLPGHHSTTRDNNNQSGPGGFGGMTGSNTYGGPGHHGSKVVHECDHCGKSNDISHYFRPEATYRIHR